MEKLYRWAKYDKNDEKTWPKISGMYTYKIKGDWVGRSYFAVPRTPINEHWEAQNITHYLVEIEADQGKLWEELVNDINKGGHTILVEKYTLIKNKQ